MCAGWGKYPNESEWKLGPVRIMLQTPLLLVPLENMDNFYTITMQLSMDEDKFNFVKKGQIWVVIVVICYDHVLNQHVK